MKNYTKDNKNHKATQYKNKTLPDAASELPIQASKIKTVNGKDYIMTSEGWHIIEPDDYLVVDLSDNAIPMKPDLFTELYMEEPLLQ